MEDNYDNPVEDIESEIAAYGISIKRLREKIEETKKKLSDSKGEWKGTKAEKEKLEKEIHQYEREIADLNLTIQNSRNSMIVTEAENDRAYANREKDRLKGKIKLINEIAEYELRIQEIQEEIDSLNEQKHSLVSNNSNEYSLSDDEEER